MWGKIGITLSLALYFLFPVQDSYGVNRTVKFKSDPIPLQAVVNQFFDLDLRSLLSDQGTGSLTWTTFNDKPAWVNLDSSKNRLFGTPGQGDIGTKRFRLGVQDGDSGALARIDITVIVVPIWTENPLDLGRQPEDSPWSFDLKNKVVNQGGGTLTFSIENPAKLPSWMTFNADGTLSGTPKRPDVGAYSGIVFIATNSQGGSSKVNAFGEVTKTIHPPKWRLASFNIDNAAEDFPYSKDVSGSEFIENFEGMPLSFEIEGAKPQWLNMTLAGNLFGTPGKNDVGPVTLTAKLTGTLDGQTYTHTAELKFRVIHTNHTPRWKNDPVNLPEGPVKVAYFQDLISFVMDPDGDNLKFKIINGPNWATITEAGVLSGTPANANVGLNEWVIEVSDGEFNPQATVRMQVRNRPPFWLNKPTDLPNGKEDFAYSQNLTSFAKDLDNDNLTFNKLSGPSWVSVASNGDVTGTPGADDVGTTTLRVRVTDEVGGNDETEVRIIVEHTNHAPKWTQDPVTLPNIPEKVAFTSDLSKFATDADKGDTLTFSKVSGPAWASISSTGQISGTPNRPDIGLNTFEVRVSDQVGASATVRVRIVVDKVNQAPRWTTKPVPLPDGLEDSAYAYDLSKIAKDDDGDLLTYRLVSGPTWMKVATNGLISGTPLKGDVGPFTASFEVSDGQLTDSNTGSAKVVMKNYPPVVIQSALDFTVKERQVFSEKLNQAKYVSDPNNDPLTFSLIDTPDWVSLASNGDLNLTPRFTHIGKHAVKFRVSDGKLSTDAVLNITVLRDPRPPVWLEDPLKFQTKARVPFTADISSKVKDLDNLTLTFSKKSGPSWLTITSAGVLQGTPPDEALGQNTFVIEAKNDLLGAEVGVIVDVLFNNHPPFWTQDPITLPKAFTEKPYSDTVAPFAKDPDQSDVLQFSKVSGTNWVQVSPAGAITGVPGKTDVGMATIQVKITDPFGLSAVATVNIPVEKSNTPPRWLKDPITLTDGLEDSPYSFNLAPLATDDDGDALTFKIVSGPNWMNVSAAGAISGTPRSADVGSFTAVFEVSDGKASARANAQGKVVKKNLPPVINQAAIAFTIKERQKFNENLNQPKYVSDPDGDPLTFTLLDTSDFVTLSSNGALAAAPLFKHIGKYALRFRVSDGKLTVDGVINIEVVRDPRPPVWLEDPIRFTTKARENFTANISGKAKDLDNLPLAFSKKSGPAWLSVSSTGVVGGTPTDDNLGENNFVLTVKNDLLGADVNVVVTVLFNNHAPYWTQDPVLLPDGTTKEAYSQSLAGFAKDPDVQDKLTFTKLGGPAWATISPEGLVTGTPLVANVGVNSFQVKVSDPSGLSATATVKINVIKGNTPPKWSKDPIPLADGLQDTTYSFDIKPFASDEDNDPLTFKKISGPTWLFVGEDGKLTGVPTKDDVGGFTAVFSVTDGKAEVQVGAFGKILKKNHPPVVKDDALVFTVKERQTLSESLNQTKYVEDMDGDKLTFALVAASEFVTLSSTGNLVIKPLFKHIGDHSLKIKVSDGELSAEGTLKIKVLRDPRPPVWLEDPIRFSAKTSVPFSASVASKAKDLDGLKLTFTKKSGPAWLTVDSNGGLTGTPGEDSVGENAFIVTVTNDVLGADVTVLISVSSSNNPPYWTLNPIILPDAKTNKAYSQNIAQFAKDPDQGDTLTFKKLGGPEWVFVTTAGLVIGTPKATDIGPVEFEVLVADQKGATAKTVVKFNVIDGNKPPRWMKDPIPLGNIPVEKAFSFNLAQFATDDDGDKLTFKKVAGPSWLQVTTDGQVVGTPGKTDLGAFTARFEASDGQAAAQADGFGKVVDDTNYPPVIVPQSLNFVVKERQVFGVNINDPKYVYDPNGDPLKFEITNPVDWISLSLDGKLELRPLHPQVGDHTFGVKVTDTKGLSTEGAMFIRVLEDPRPPVWLENPIRMEAKVNTPFTNTLSDKAKDLDEKPLTFSKKSGPAWLNVAASGALTGTPQAANLGDNTFVVTVSNGTYQVDATLIITVKQSADNTDLVVIDSPVPGAESENLWVIDNSWPWIGKNKLIKELEDKISIYYDALANAQIHHSGVYLSSDVQKWKGLPVRDKNKTAVFLWGDSNLLDGFIERLKATHSNKCASSPLWAMWKFYDQVPKIDDVYHKKYMEPAVPMDAIIITNHADQYKSYTKGTPQQNYTPDDFARDFVQFHNNENKSYRVSAIAPECPKLLDPESPQGVSTAPNPYRPIVKLTGGTYYPQPCNFDMAKVMRDYAQKVIFRSYVQAKKRIKLTKTPLEPSKIRVTLGGELLPGNTGSQLDRWYYDPATNEIVVRWYLIDMSKVKPGDVLRIEYKI